MQQMVSERFDVNNIIKRIKQINRRKKFAVEGKKLQRVLNLINEKKKRNKVIKNLFI